MLQLAPVRIEDRCDQSHDREGVFSSPSITSLGREPNPNLAHFTEIFGTLLWIVSGRRTCRHEPTIPGRIEELQPLADAGAALRGDLQHRHSGPNTFDVE